MLNWVNVLKGFSAVTALCTSFGLAGSKIYKEIKELEASKEQLVAEKSEALANLAKAQSQLASQLEQLELEKTAALHKLAIKNDNSFFVKLKKVSSFSTDASFHDYLLVGGSIVLGFCICYGAWSVFSNAPSVDKFAHEAGYRLGLLGKEFNIRGNDADGNEILVSCVSDSVDAASIVKIFFGPEQEPVVLGTLMAIKHNSKILETNISTKGIEINTLVEKNKVLGESCEIYQDTLAKMTALTNKKIQTIQVLEHNIIYLEGEIHNMLPFIPPQVATDILTAYYEMISNLV